MPSDRIQKLRDKAAQLQAQIKDLQARERQQDRKDDTRRKVIVGALALEHMVKNKDSAFFKTLWPLLDEYVTRQQDRDLLNAYFQTAGVKELPVSETRGGANDDADKGDGLKEKFGSGQS